MTLVDDIYSCLIQRQMSMGELQKATDTNIYTLRHTVGLLTRVGLIQRRGLNYNLTEFGKQQLSAPVAKAEPAPKVDIFDLLPDKQIFTTTSVYTDLVAQGMKVHRRDVGRLLRGLSDEKRIIRVSPLDQPNAKPIQYIKGLEKGEWICHNCGGIHAEHEFEEDQWGTTGAVCLYCAHKPTQTVIKPDEIVRVGQCPEELSQKMDEMIDILKQTHDLFLKLSQQKSL